MNATNTRSIRTEITLTGLITNSDIKTCFGAEIT